MDSFPLPPTPPASRELINDVVRRAILRYARQYIADRVAVSQSWPIVISFDYTIVPDGCTSDYRIGIGREIAGEANASGWVMKLRPDDQWTYTLAPANKK